MKNLIFYDNDGRVWAVYVGETAAPSELNSILVDAPEMYKSITVNVGEKTVTFEEFAEEELNQMKNE